MNKISVSGKRLKALAIAGIVCAVSTTSWAQDREAIQPASSFQELNRFDSTLKVIQASKLKDSVSLSGASQASFQSIDGLQSPQQTTNEDRIDSIHDRINLLKKLIREKKAAEASAKTEAETAPKPAPVIDTPATPSDETFPPTPALSSVDVTDVSESTINEEPKMHTSPVHSGQISGSPVVTEPVNSFEMANSLFFTGNISAARKSYQAKLREKVSPDDEAWLKCFVACCFRLEGNFAKAEETFREVSNLKQKSYPVDYAKWSLQYVAQRRIALEQFQSIDKDIDSILKKLNKND